MNYRSEAEIRAAQRHEGDLGSEAPQEGQERSAVRSERASDLCCNHDCNQGRECPYRKRVPVWRPPAWAYVATAAIWGAILWVAF